MPTLESSTLQNTTVKALASRPHLELHVVPKHSELTYIRPKATGSWEPCATQPGHMNLVLSLTRDA